MRSCDAPGPKRARTWHNRATQEAPPKLAQDLGQALKQITQERWLVSVVSAVGQATLAEQDRQAEAEKKQKLLQEPLVQNILQMFPGSDIKKIYPKGS